MMTQRRRLVLIVLVIVTIGATWRMVWVERQKHELAKAYEAAWQMAKELEMERNHLNDELLKARETVDAQAGDIGSLQHELQGVQDRLKRTTTEIASLKKAHEELRQQDASLKAQLGEVTLEKEQLEAKLSDLKELKLAIRDVKRKMWNERLTAWRARMEAQREVDQQALASGNRGLVLRQGVSTLGANPRLHVHVLEPESQ